MKVNTKILDLERLMTMAQATVWDMTRILNNVKKELLTARELLIEYTFEFGQNVDELQYIDQQLFFVNNNLKTLEEALLHHESKIFKMPIGKQSQQVFCLN